MTAHIDNLIRNLSESKENVETFQEVLNKKLEEFDKAIQWNGNNLCELILFAGDNLDYTWKNWTDGVHVSAMTICTPEGKRKVLMWNYIVKQEDGSFYTCKPKKFFQSLYEKRNVNV